jgi:phytoene dehydrogenase-like protein
MREIRGCAYEIATNAYPGSSQAGLDMNGLVLQLLAIADSGSWQTYRPARNYGRAWRSMEQYDFILVGGGHNGLVCAFYLAKAGRRVRLLERSAVVGGAAITEEFHPGFRNSVASYSVGLLHPQVIADLDLVRHGLRIVIRPLSYFAPQNDSEYLIVDKDARRTHEAVARFSRRDAERLHAYHERMDRLVDLVRSVLLQTPLDANGGVADLLQGIALGRRVRKLGVVAQRDLVNLFGRSAGEMLDDWFECDALKGVLGFDSIIGNYASPYTPGSAYVLLHHIFGEVNGIRGAWGHAIGGMGSITQAMAQACREVGVEISTSAPVTRVDIQGGRACGVTLESGEVIEAQGVVCSVHPQLLFGKLVPRAELPADFIERIDQWKSGSGTFRMNVALSELPSFTCLPGAAAAEQHRASIIIAPSLPYLDDAYQDARKHGWARQPAIEMHIPSTLDDSLAPPGAHVASLFCQHFAPTLPAGRSWDECREQVADLVIDTVTRYATNFKRSVLARTALTPLDLERKLGLVRGDIFHGRLSLDQLYSARPMIGHAAYRSPVAGLYMCGSATHPGGGVTGMPGLNAAREILGDWRGGKVRWPLRSTRAE